VLQTRRFPCRSLRNAPQTLWLDGSHHQIGDRGVVHRAKVDLAAVLEFQASFGCQGHEVFAGILSRIGMGFREGAPHRLVEHRDRGKSMADPSAGPVAGTLTGFVGGKELSGGQSRCAAWGDSLIACSVISPMPALPLRWLNSLG
jgi:hypothetical protein